MSQQSQENQNKQKRKNQIFFAVASLASLLIVGVFAFVILSKIKTSNSSEILSQDQFEGTAEVSNQLQAECQNSAVKISTANDVSLIESEFRQYAENCKDVYFAVETDSTFRKEGMYADLAVDIATMLEKTDKSKAIDLLKFARSLKSWDFYLGPVSCDSHQVLDAYLESFSSIEEKQCLTIDEIKLKIFPEILAKNFSFISKLVAKNNVLWLGLPDSDVGCPESISSIKLTLKKLSTGPVYVEDKQIQMNDGNNLNIEVKISEKEYLSFVFIKKNECFELSSVLIPSEDISE